MRSGVVVERGDKAKCSSLNFGLWKNRQKICSCRKISSKKLKKLGLKTPFKTNLEKKLEISGTCQICTDCRKIATFCSATFLNPTRRC